MPVSLYFVTRALTGVANSISIALAYIADKTSPQHRAPAFGLLLATATLGTSPPPLSLSRSLCRLLFLARFSLRVFTEQGWSQPRWVLAWTRDR